MNVSSIRPFVIDGQDLLPSICLLATVHLDRADQPECGGLFTLHVLRLRVK